MKNSTSIKRILATIISISLLLCCTTTSVNAKTYLNTNYTAEAAPLSTSAIPSNIKTLLPQDQNNLSVYLNADSSSTSIDNTELYTIRVEDKNTGKGSLIMHSSPVKYVDSAGKLQFIDTSIKPITARTKLKNGYAYQNAANSFTVEYGGTAEAGINFNNAFTFTAKGNDTSGEIARSESLNVKDVEVLTENGNGKLRYANVFGSNTTVEYINTTNGIKENIILDSYTGKNRFDFIFHSKTHTPVLGENGAYILVAPNDKPEVPEYRFLSLYAYDSYNPTTATTESSSEFRHMNEELYYELKKVSKETYIVSVVVPVEYLSHPEIVYPVTIDPSITRVSSSSNTHDTFVHAGTPDVQNNYNLDYIRFGTVGGYRNYGYHRFAQLPNPPAAYEITSAEFKLTFRSGQTTPTASTGMKIYVLRVKAHQWYESSITWNNQPFGTTGASPYITYNGPYLNYVAADVTEIVREWYSGVPNYGVDFTYENADYNDYNSIVSSNGEAARAPVLVINYENTLRVGYSIQDNYQSPCAMSDMNYPSFANYADKIKNRLGTDTTYFSYSGSNSYSNDLKSDSLTGGIGYRNIEDVDLMFYIGHGYKKGDYHAGCGTPQYNSLHFGTTNSSVGHSAGDGNNPAANFTTYDARYFGYNSRVKWLVAYSCNFLETNDGAVLNMLSNGGRLVLGFSSKMVVNADEGELFAKKCREDWTLQEAFFNAAGRYQESTFIHGQKYVSCLYFYDTDNPNGTKDDTLIYQNPNVTRERFYCKIYNVKDISPVE